MTPDPTYKRAELAALTDEDLAAYCRSFRRLARRCCELPEQECERRGRPDIYREAVEAERAEHRADRGS